MQTEQTTQLAVTHDMPIADRMDQRARYAKLPFARIRNLPKPLKGLVHSRHVARAGRCPNCIVRPREILLHLFPGADQRHEGVFHLTDRIGPMGTNAVRQPTLRNGQKHQRPTSLLKALPNLIHRPDRTCRVQMSAEARARRQRGNPFRKSDVIE